MRAPQSRPASHRRRQPPPSAVGSRSADGSAGHMVPRDSPRRASRCGGRGSVSRRPSPGPPGTVASSPGATEPPDIDLSDLSRHVGETVRVGGFVTAVDADGFRLDDGTGQAIIELAGDAASYLSVLGPDDALNATGAVIRTE